jgi:hypothetical protein
VLRWMNWRGEQAEQEFAEVVDLRLTDVILVATTASGTVEVSGLGLCFDKLGLTVRKSGGEQVVQIAWPLLRSVTVPTDHRATKGAIATIALIVQSDRRRHRFVVHNADPGALSASLAAVSTRYAGRDLTRIEEGAALHRRPNR